MKILIAGAGKVGKALVSELSNEGHDITVVDRESKVLADAVEKFDVYSLHGNSASKTTLEEAGIEDMDLLIAATNTDEVNLLSCITAHGMNPNLKTIARIRDPEYVEQAYSMRDVFGLNLVVNPERQAALEIARLLKYPGFLKREVFARARAEIVELKVKEDSVFNNTQLSKLASIVNSQVLVVAVIRDGQVFMPDGNFVLQENDHFYVTGDPEELHNMLMHTGVITKPVKHAFITGGGRITYYLAQELKKVNISSTIIEIDEKKCENLASRLPYATIIQGDVSDRTILDDEEINQYDAFVSMTGMDELNMVTSSYAHMANIPEIVTKLGRGDEAKLTDLMPIGSVVCPKDLCTSHIVRYVRALQETKGAALTVHRIAEGQIEAIEFVVDEDTEYQGIPLKDVPTRKDVLIASISQGRHVEIASGTSKFEKGNTVVVATRRDNPLHNLNDIFEG